MKRILLAALTLTALAQQPSVVFRTTTNLVILDVAVRDKSGKEITGLKKEDFTVTEDGKAQAVAVFEFQKLESRPLPPAPPPTLVAEAAAPLTPAAPAPQPAAAARANTIASVAPGKVQYQDKRLIVMLFDFSSMQPAEQLRAQKSALEFLQKQMTAADAIAVMTFAGKLEVQQDFTNDRDLLAQVIKGFRIGEGSELSVLGDTGDDTGEDTGAAFTADDTEFNVFNTDNKLAALESAAKMLAALPEKKALVYFSSGISKTGTENESQLRSTINAAIRANVSFYPVDARGLVAMVPGGDASKASSRGTMLTGATQRQQASTFQGQQETLVTLASDTGGKAMLDTNDLTQGITQVQEDVQSYYIVGYYSTNSALDGRYRRVQVKLAGNPQAKLDYRSGYFGAKQFGKFTDADKEQQLQEALMLGDPVTDLPLAVEVDYFRLAHDSYFVPVSVKVPGSVIAMVKRGANQITEFDFIGQVRDAKGRLMANVRDGIRVKLDENDAAQLGHRNFEYDTGFTLAPGAYTFKFLARENQTGKMGTFETRFEIPDLVKQADRLHVSSVIWSNQREPIAAAVGSADNRKKLLATSPLVEEGQKIVPSITRVFRQDQHMYVYMEVYDAAHDPAALKPSVAATLTFYRGRVKAFESEPVRLADLAAKRNSTLPVKFQVPLAKLRPGRYICQVSVFDEVGRKFAFPRAAIVLLP